MRKLFWICVLIITAAGCSSDEDTSGPGGDGQYFDLNFGGIDVPFTINDFGQVNSAAITRGGDNFTVNAFFGVSFGTDSMLLYFTKDGKLIDMQISMSDPDFDVITYSSYKNFRDNYFDLEILSHDEAAKRIKVAYSGTLYLNGEDMSTESVFVEGEFELNYQGDETAYDGIMIGEFQTNCSALFNGQPWEATHENYPSAPGPSIFTASDAYRVEIYFAPSTNATGTFNVTPVSEDNYVRLAKFNTTTMVFDYYDVTGTIDYHYKEFHGATDWTYFGNFSFTAVNPDNPADVIQVTDGEFISYQKY